MKKLFQLSVTLGALLVSTNSSNASLSFSGGNGAPLKMEIDAPIEFVVTVAGGPIFAPIFVFDGVGMYGFSNSIGTITYTVAGNSYTFTNPIIASMGMYHDLKLGDFYFLPTGEEELLSFTFALGEKVILNSLSFTSTEDFEGEAPASGDYSTFFIDIDPEGAGGANKIAEGPQFAAVPEQETRWRWRC